MQVKVLQDKLSKALTYTSKAVSSKPNIPVLANVLIAADKESVKLSATNLDMGINMWIATQTEEQGSTTVSGKYLADFVNAAGGDKVDLRLNGDSLQVQTGNSHADFQTIDSSEFPVLPKADSEPFFTIDKQTFLESMDKVIFACATDLSTAKIQHTGVLFDLPEKDSSSITFVGLNGYRMSQRKAQIQRSSQDAEQLIVPARALQELVKVVDNEDVDNIEVHLSSSKSQLVFKLGDGEIEFSVRLLEGPYPDYKAVIPTEYQYAYEVGRKEFEQAMRIVNTFARSLLGNQVKCDLDLETAKLTLASQVTDLGTNQTQLELDKAEGASDLKDAYGLHFLMEMISHMNGETVRFETNAPLSPALFKDPDDPDYLHVIMPMQRDDA